MEQPLASPSPWSERRRRAAQLRERHPFAAEVLTLYLALLDVQEPAFAAAAGAGPEDVPRLARALLPRVIEATAAAGPATLVERAVARFHAADLDDVVGRWLCGTDQSAVDRYLARAACGPVLEAMDRAALSVLCVGERGPRRCPACGGPPQLGYFALSDEALVTGPRHLVCARCAASWVHPRMVCAGCGEVTSTRLPFYAEADLFPHARVDACETCRQYLIAFDLRRDAEAVPVVDELAALPLDLYAKERGLRKVTPDLMGF